jgi:lipoprotein NlpI
MRIKTVLPIICFAFLVGCASEPQTGHPSNMAWYQAGISADQIRRDLADCQNESLAYGKSSIFAGESSGGGVIIDYIAEQARQNNIVQSCMIAKGYSLVKTNSPLLSMVLIADANIVEIEKTKAENGDAEAQFNLGNLYYTGYTNNVCAVATDYTESIKWFQKAADQNYPDMQFPLASAYAKRGALEERNGDLDGALADFNKAIEIKPDFTEIYAGRGYVKQGKGDLDGAMADYNRAIELNPTFASAYFLRGLLNYDSHKFTDALADFQTYRALGLDAQSQDYSHLYTWLIRARLGEQNAATAELQAYLNNRKTGTPDDWPSKIGSFLTGQLTESDFFKAAENSDQQTSKGQHCEAYFYAGSERLIEGDRTIAADYFDKCLATGCIEFDEYGSAAAELKLLQTSK